MATMPCVTVDSHAGPRKQELGRAWSRCHELDLEPPVNQQCPWVDSQVGKHRLSWKWSSPSCCREGGGPGVSGARTPACFAGGAGNGVGEGKAAVRTAAEAGNAIRAS